MRRLPRLSHPSPRYALQGLALASALLALTACGDGGGGSAPAAAGGNAAPASLSIAITDGPSTDFSNAFVTITAVKVHKSASTVDADDAGWLTFTLAAPLTVDLNSLGNGALQSVLGGMSLPAGTYGQIRLMLAAWDDPLASSAQAVTVNGVPLAYNDTIVEANGNQFPLEIAYPTQGLALNGTFTIGAGQTLSLAIEFNVGDDIVRFRHGIGHAYTMNPTLHYYDTSSVGAITGRLDPSACAATPATSTSCQGFVVKAETLSDDGTHYRIARWTAVRPDGSFTLYPVPASAGQTYDVMIRGRNAETMIVQSVPVTPGTTGSNGTVLSSTALPVTGGTEYTVNTNGSQPTAAVVQFYQSVPGKTAPYEIRTRQTDPFAGNFWTPEPLAAGNVLVGTYIAGGTPQFNTQTPVEGAGGYQVWFNDPYFARTSAGTVTGANTIAGPALTQGDAVATLGTITGTLSPSIPGKWTSGQLVVTRFGRIVNSVDVSSLVGLGGTYTVGALPAGSAAKPFAPGYYYAYLRLWNAGSAAPNKVRIVRVPGFADLRRTGSGVLNVTLP